MAIGRIPEPGTGIPESIVDAKGDIVTATAADTPARLAVGTNEHRLVAASGETTGLKYVADTTNYAVAAKGDLLVGTAADTLAPLTVGTDGYTLVADSSTATGLAYAAPAAGALTLIKTQTIGSGVTSVAVTSVFSSTYDNYQIMISGGVASASCDLNLKLGSTTTGYYEAGFYNYANNGNLVGDSTNNGSIFLGFGSGSADALNGIGQIQSPNLAKFTTVQYAAIRNATADSIASRSMGFEASTTQHTDFTIEVGGGANITGGTIKVYGYQN